MLIRKAKAMSNTGDTDVIVVPATGENRTESFQRRGATKVIECRNGQEPARMIIAIAKLCATLRAAKMDIEKVDKKFPSLSRRRSR
jgi:hypothetical protein